MEAFVLGRKNGNVRISLPCATITNLSKDQNILQVKTVHEVLCPQMQ